MTITVEHNRNMGWSPGRIKSNTIKLVFVVSPLYKSTALRRKSKDWLARNQNNVSEWSDMSTRDCCFRELAL